MFAIYYTDPQSGERYVCTTGNWRQFHPDSVAYPAMYSQEKNAAKIIREWPKAAAQYAPYDAIHIFDANDREIKTVKPIPYKDIEIVPLKMVPDFTTTTKADSL